MRRIERLAMQRLVEISALKGNGIKLLTREIIRAAENGKAVIPAHIFTGSVEHAIAI